MRLLVIGAGYVGLVTAACFSEVGYQTYCVDVDEKKIAKLLQGEIPIYEPGLKEMVVRNSQEKRLHFGSNYREALQGVSFCFLCVDTPSDAQGACSMDRIEKVVESLSLALTDSLIVVVKSTVPVGSCEKIQKLLRQKLDLLGKKSLSFEIASNPEFLKEGCAIADFMKPDRLVIGVQNQQTAQRLSSLYTPFNLNHERILLVDLRSAEMIKYASNAMLATRISFMNELSVLCESVGADISSVRKGMGSDTRIGHAFLYAGVGFGGSCFPKDIRALQALARSNKIPTILLEDVEQVNHCQKERLAKKVLHYFGSDKTPTLAVWGLAFKPDTDDMREAPSLVFIQRLWEKGYTLRLFDPMAMEPAKIALQNLQIGPERIQWCTSAYEATLGSEGIALITEWKQFRQIDFQTIYPQMKNHVIFDGRNQYRHEELLKEGFSHVTLGRKDSFVEKDPYSR